MIKKGIICETLGSTDKLQLNESKNGEIRLSGVFGVCGVRNNNRRVYEKKNYGACVTEMQHRIVSEGVLGELEHPQSSNINLNNVSHKIESIEMNEDGTITGTILLLNTAKGRDAKAIVEGGVPLFISSRAAGSIDASGNVKLDHIQTYDLVGTPGFSQARLDLEESSVGDTVALCESVDGANNMYMIVESVVSEAGEDGLEIDDKKGEPKKDEPKKDEPKEDEPKKDEPKDDEPKDDEPKDDEPKDDEPNSNTDILNNMNDIKKSIDELTDKIASLESELHVAQESLASQADTIAVQKAEIDSLNEARVNYDAIQSWIEEEYSAEVGNKISEAIKEADNSVSVAEATKSEIKEWCTSTLSDAIQSWITEEYSKELQNWITEEYSKELQNWITEEYGAEVDNKINESVANLAESITEKCNENISAFLESKKADKFEKFDKMIAQLAESKEDATEKALKMLNESREEYSNVYAVKNMPVQYAPLWESLSSEKRSEIARSSRMYDFTKKGVLESFWSEQFKYDNHQNNLIQESINESQTQKTIVPNRYASLFARAKKMALR